MVKVTDDGVFPVPREKVWRLIEAHGTDLQSIHPNVKSVKSLDKEGTTIETTRDIGGQSVKSVLKITPSPPDKLTLEFLQGPMIGKIVNTYTEVSGGTKVVTDCDMKSQTMDDKQIESTLRQTLNEVFEDDLRYLRTKLA
jgi:uncharacterized protein YndB with AHSA1/START domain